MGVPAVLALHFSREALREMNGITFIKEIFEEGRNER